MRCLVLFLLAACELQPAPKQQPAAAKPVPQQAEPAPPVTPPDAAVAVATADAAVQVTDDCVAVGVHLVEVMIKVSTDPAQKNTLEQERTTIVRKTAEACTQQNWSNELRDCWKKAQTAEDLTTCSSKVPGTEPAPKGGQLEKASPPPEMTGSGAGSGGAVKRPEPKAQRPGAPNTQQPGAPTPRPERPKRPASGAGSGSAAHR